MIWHLVCLLAGAFAVIVLRQRIHFHFSFTVSRGQKSQPPVMGDDAAAGLRSHQFERRRSAHVQRGKLPAAPLSSDEGPSSWNPSPLDDLSSALENLGAPKHRAKAAAQHVLRNWPGADFDTQLRAAFQEVGA